MARAFSPPDVLVLGAGGVVGEAWLTGMLAGIEDEAEIDLRKVEHLVGTSAGSIVSAHLAAGRRPRRPHEADDRPGRPDNAASRSTRTRGPTETTSGSTVVAIRLYVITYRRDERQRRWVGVVRVSTA